MGYNNYITISQSERLWIVAGHDGLSPTRSLLGSVVGKLNARVLLVPHSIKLSYQRWSCQACLLLQPSGPRTNLSQSENLAGPQDGLRQVIFSGSSWGRHCFPVCVTASVFWSEVESIGSRQTAVFQVDRPGSFIPIWSPLGRLAC